MPALDTAAYASAWRLRHPGDKAVLALGLLACAVALPPWPAAPLVAAVALCALLGSARVPARLVVRVVRVPLGFVAVGALPLALTVGRGGVGLDTAALPAVAEVAGRSGAAVLSLVLLAATTPLADVLPRLRRLGVPAAVVEVAALTYSMLSLLLISVATVREAQAARLGTSTRRRALRSAALQASSTFVRVFDRARRLEEGLALRGSTGALEVLVEERRRSARFLAASAAVLAGVVTASLLVGAR